MTFKTDQPDSVSVTLQTFSTNQVADIARVTMRQLQWWDERKVVQPRHEGHRRVYEIEEALDIVVIAELRRKGCSLQALRRALRGVHRQIHAAVDKSPDAEHVLVVSPTGKSVAVFDDADEAIRFQIRQHHAHLVISLAEAMRAVRDYQPPKSTPRRRTWLT